MQENHEAPSRIERLVLNPAVRSTYASLLGHVAVLVLLARLAIPLPGAPRPRPIVITASDPADLVAEVAAPAPAGELLEAAAALAAVEMTVVTIAPEMEAITVEHDGPSKDDLAATTTGGAEAGPQPAAAELGAGSPAPDAGVAYAGRRGAARSRGVTERGGTQGSEEAVDRGLAWLALHQAEDGSWRFDLSGCSCQGGCRDPGSVTSTTAATGLALLPFLGAGHTHLEGDHQKTVSRGLYYLMSRMRFTSRGGDLSEGTMYGQGTATIALAEALGMTRDDMLVPYVRDAVRFIATAQHGHSGGWRYLPAQPGDMTVTAWQLAALRSAALAGMPVPSPTMDGVKRFLDRVQFQQGEAYGYQSPHPRPATSAIGLLCRLYTRWPNEAAIDRGLAALAKPGPAADAVYLNFYLSQALMQRDHPLWPKWNDRNREQLVNRQERHGHEAGSWFFADRETSSGGRLAHTALATLTLEVYYRLLPIYGSDAVTAEW